MLARGARAVADAAAAVGRAAQRACRAERRAPAAVRIVDAELVRRADTEASSAAAVGCAARARRVAVPLAHASPELADLPEGTHAHAAAPHAPVGRAARSVDRAVGQAHAEPARARLVRWTRARAQPAAPVGIAAQRPGRAHGRATTHAAHASEPRWTRPGTSAAASVRIAALRVGSAAGVTPAHALDAVAGRALRARAGVDAHSVAADRTRIAQDASAQILLACAENAPLPRSAGHGAARVVREAHAMTHGSRAARAITRRIGRARVTHRIAVLAWRAGHAGARAVEAAGHAHAVDARLVGGAVDARARIDDLRAYREAPRACRAVVPEFTGTRVRLAATL